MSDEIDYAAELARTRAEQGLPVELPTELRQAVAALLGADRDDTG